MGWTDAMALRGQLASSVLSWAAGRPRRFLEKRETFLENTAFLRCFVFCALFAHLSMKRTFVEKRFKSSLSRQRR